MTAAQQADLARCLAEQRAALNILGTSYFSPSTEARKQEAAALLWLNDQVAEEVLIRLEAQR